MESDSVMEWAIAVDELGPATGKDGGRSEVAAVARAGYYREVVYRTNTDR